MRDGGYSAAMSDQPSPMDPNHPDPLVPIVPPTSPEPQPDVPPMPTATGDDQDAPGLSVLGEQDGDPVEPNEPG